MTTFRVHAPINEESGRYKQLRLGYADARTGWEGCTVRNRLPDRRQCWTQKVRIEGHTFYLTCGEYDDGKLGEIWIVADKEGTFLRGVLDGLARTASISLQNGTPVEEVVLALRSHNFPPKGVVESGGTSAVKLCTSVLDWVAKEIEAAYVRRSASPGTP